MQLCPRLGCGEVATPMASGKSGGTELPDNKAHLPQQFHFPKSELGETSGQEAFQAKSQRRD